MVTVRYRGLADLRRNWKAVVGIALLIGLVGTVVLTALAGARRSSSAYTRFREQSRAGDGTVFYSDPSRLQQVAQLPQVAAVGRVVVPFFAPFAPEELGDVLLVTSPGGFLTDVDRVRMIEGRLPAADRPHEVALNERVTAALHLAPGGRLVLRSFSPEQFASEGGPESGPAGPTIVVRVVGIVRSTFDISDEETEERPSGYLPPAFFRTYGEDVAAFDGFSRIRLRNGPADVPAFGAAVARIFADDPEFAFAPDSTEVARVDDAIGVVAIGLRLFAAAAALAGLVALGQVLNLTVARMQSDGELLAALGMSRWQRMGSSLLALTPGLVAGAVLAPLGAALASPLMPINLARKAEPDPGLSVDALVLGTGCVAVAVLGVGIAFASAWRSTRHNEPHPVAGADGATMRSGRVRAAALARGPVTARTGAHMAFHRGTGRTAVPVRSSLMGAALGAGALVAVMVFIASQHTLVRSPTLYGWNWDASVVPPEFEGGGPEAGEFSGELVGDDAIADVSLVRVSHAVLGGSYLHVLGFSDLKGTVAPTVLQGRAPRAADEAAFGAATLRHLGLSIGDRLRVPGVEGPVSVEVVGRVVIPSLGTDAIADEGAVMTGEGADRLATTQSSFDLLLNWRRGVDPVAARRSLEKRVGDVITEKPPTDVKNLARIGAIPRALAIFLGGLAVLALGHALVATVRRRARDLAVLRALGFRPRQVSAAVAWQASLMTGAGLIIGLPLGVAAGRWSWAVVASAMGLRNQPAVPLLIVAFTVPAALALAIVVAVLPGRAAARRNPAAALRTE